MAQLRTFDYQLLCNRLGLHYLPSNKRISILENSDNIQTTYDREDVIAYLDKAVSEYYKTLVNRLGKNKISFYFPVLFDYIKYCCGDKISFESILQLHDTKEIKGFRTWMDTLETQIQQGNILALEQTLRLIPEMVNDITKLVPSTQTATLEIGLTPSLTLPINPAHIYSILKRSQIKVHTDFLQILTDYAFTKRRE